MLLEIPCPKCQSKLRSPTDIRGKTVRCKKCNEKFRVPMAEEPVVEPGQSTGDTQQLSVIDTDFLPEIMPKPASAPIAVAKILRVEPEAELLVLEDIAVAKLAPQPLPLPLPSEPPPAPAMNAFAFDEQENLKKKKKKHSDDDDEEKTRSSKKKKRDDDDEDEDRPRKKKKRDDDDDDEVRPKYAGTKGSALPMIMMIGVGGGALLLAVIAGVLFLTGVIGGKKEVAKATTAPTSKVTTNSTTAQSRNTPTPTEPTPPTTTTTPNTGGTPTPTTRRPPPTGPSKQPGPMGVVKLPTMPPATPELIAKPKSVTAIDIPAEKIQAVRWGNKGTYHVIFAGYRDSEGFRGAGVSDTIEAFNADTGEKMGTMKVKADKCKWPRAFEASPNGKFAAIEGPAGMLTVYDFEDGKFVMEATDVNVGMANRGNSIVGLSWLDDDKLVVVDSHGSTDTWSMATKQPTLRMNNLPGYEGKKVRAITRLGTTGKTFLIARDSELLYLKDINGTQIPYTGTPMFVAADTTGSQVAVIGKEEGKPYDLTVLNDVTKPGRQQKVTFPAEVGEVTGIAWQSIYTLVVTLDGGKSSLIVDLDPEIGTPTLAMYVKAPDGKARIFDQGPFQYLYYAVSEGKGSKFASINLDFDDYGKLRNSAKDSKPPSPIYMVPSDKGLSK